MAIHTQIPAAMTPSSLTSRISNSATGLAKDLFETRNATAADVTSELTALRNTHKISSRNGHGFAAAASSSPRLPKALSSRLRSSAPFRSLRATPDVESEDEGLERELQGFLAGECGFGSASASSSRSASPLDLGEGMQHGFGTGFLAREGQTREMDGRVGESAGHATLLSQDFWVEDGEAALNEDHHHSYDLDSDRSLEYPRNASSSFPHPGKTFNSSLEKKPETRQLDTPWNDHLTSSLNLASSSTKNNTSETRTLQIKQRALDRLQLLASHLPSIRAAEKAATEVTRAPAVSLDTAYNQLCQGDETQEWMDFATELSDLNILATEHQDLAVIQGNTLATGMSQHRMIGREDISMAETTQQMQELKILQHERLHQAEVEQQQRQQQSEKEDEEFPTFHCPWVECHRRFQICTEYIRDAEKVDVLPCVHAGCELEFSDKGSWNEHVFSAHHDLLSAQTSDVTDVREAVGPVDAGEEGLSGDMEVVWEETQK